MLLSASNLMDRNVVGAETGQVVQGLASGHLRAEAQLAVAVGPPREHLSEVSWRLVLRLLKLFVALRALRSQRTRTLRAPTIRLHSQIAMAIEVITCFASGCSGDLRCTTLSSEYARLA